MKRGQAEADEHGLGAAVPIFRHRRVRPLSRFEVNFVIATDKGPPCVKGIVTAPPSVLAHSHLPLHRGGLKEILIMTAFANQGGTA